MAPVSVRSDGERGTLGNKVAMWLMALPIGEPDPSARIAAVKEATKNLKETDQALGASTLVQVSTGAPATLVSLATRLAGRVRPFNMTVTNVPGPQFPLYLAGSSMLATYPLVPLWQSHGAGIAMFSVNGSVDVGINMDRTVVEYPGRLAPSIMESYEELLAAPAAGSEEPPRPKAKKMPPMGTR